MTPAEQREFAAKLKALRVNINTAPSVNAEVSGGVESRHALAESLGVVNWPNKFGQAEAIALRETPQAGVAPGPLTSADRHKPGYMAAYMRQYRASKKEHKP